VPGQPDPWRIAVALKPTRLILQSGIVMETMVDVYRVGLMVGEVVAVS
jgi:hypothetical protein